MPLITVTTNIEDRAVWRQVASAVAEHFCRTGVTPSHVTTRFVPCGTDDLYFAGDPLVEVAGDVGFALVQVGMSARRPDSFRAELAGAITDAFGDHAERTRISIDFVDREPHDAYIANRPLGQRPPTPTSDLRPSGLLRGESPGSTLPAGPDQLRGVDEVDVRSALRDLDWPEEVLTADASTLLADLAPEHLGSWDSLAAVVTVDELIDVLGLSSELFDRGQQDFTNAFGEDARLQDLCTYVTARSNPGDAASLPIAEVA